MTGPTATAVRSVTYLAVTLAAFAGVLMALPEPVSPSRPADAALAEVDFAIVRAKIFDGEAFRPEEDVWIEAGRIRRVGQGLDLPADLPRVDGSGRTLVPGLIDGHVHTWGSALNDALRFGVTTVLDQFSDPVLVASKRPARAELARGDEADIFSAGMLATAAGGMARNSGYRWSPWAVQTMRPLGCGHEKPRAQTGSRSCGETGAHSAGTSRRSAAIRSARWSRRPMPRVCPPACT